MPDPFPSSKKRERVGNARLYLPMVIFGPLHACMHVPHTLFNGIEVGNGSKERQASLGERGLCNKEGMEGSVRNSLSA